MEISIKWNVCRICLQEESKTAVDPLKPIFQDKELARHIYDITGVVIKEEDSLPDKVCSRCLNGIKSAVSLRVNCRKSDKYLKSVLYRTQSATSLFRLNRKHDDVCNSLEDITEDADEWQSKEDAAVETAASTKSSEQPINNNKRKFDSDVDLDDSGGGGNGSVSSSVAVASGSRKRIPIRIKKEQDTESNTTSTMHFDNHAGNKPKKNIANSTTLTPDKSPKAQSHYSDQNINDMLEEDHQQQLVEHEDDDEMADEFDKHSRDLNPISSECSIDTLNMLVDERSSTSATSKRLKLKSPLSVEHTNSEVHFEDDSQEHINPTEPDGDNRPALDMYFVLNEEDIKKEYIHNKSDNDEDIDSTNTLEMINMDEAEFIDDEEDEMELDERANITYNEHIEYIVDELPDHDNVEAEAEEEDTPDDEDASSIRSNNVIELKLQDTQPNSVCSMPILSPVSQTRKNSYNTHAPVNNFHVCEVCGNSFTSRSLLNYHMRTHRQPKNFECELCFKRFNAACNLTAHMRTHTGEKPFECQYCHRRFTDRSTHIKHERIHTNEKPFNCNRCGKSFSLSTTLKAHEKVHTGEKPFKCEPCKKSFKLPHQLKAHLNTHQHKILAVEH